jgi:hypothetical protein
MVYLGLDDWFSFRIDNHANDVTALGKQEIPDALTI